MHKFTNRLAQSASPYLLQHAHNPVDWFEWNAEALQKAKDEDKPILVSIGYSSCHWCHVMERESFENEEVARVMNELFVCIKVDREERPDIDQVYMDAVQALGVHGGWPLNVFLTPEQKPFFGGTYFSPPVWTQVLNNVQKAFQQNRDNIEQTAEELRLHLLRSDVSRFKQPAGDDLLLTDAGSIYQKLETGFDYTWGGLDKAPKFVMPSVWHWLLRYHHLSKNDNARTHVLHTLRKIGMGGIYDQAGGGFARYSVDAYWFAPHFEKMLYDNAQLMSLYSEAFAISKEEEFKTIVYETFEWLNREMTGPTGGFYSALDADSEGVEGKFYCWTKSEFDKVLGDDATLVGAYYSVTEKGNWEHGMNILIRYKSDDEFLREHSISKTQWRNQLLTAKQKLLDARASRIRPGLDDKIITSWNAMMICGLTSAYRAFQDSKFLDAALRNIQFLEKELVSEHGFRRSYKGKASAVHAFLDDYAYLIKAYIELYQTTFDEQWIRKAGRLMTFAIADFFDASDGYFHYSGRHAEKLISGKKEIFDNVIPSSNSVMALNLFQLSVILENAVWQTYASEMINGLSVLIKGEPNYMSNWGIAWLELRKGLAQVALTGPDVETRRSEFQRDFRPFALTLGSSGPSDLPLLADKTATGSSSIYVCYDKSCQPPVKTVNEANSLLIDFIK